MRWRPALRIARRDATRARGRSALVLVMIGLPVLAIVALDTLGRTSDVSVREGLSRQIGAADAVVRYQGDATSVSQSPTLSSYGSTASATKVTPPTSATIRTLLGGRGRIIDFTEGDAAVDTAVGVARPAAFELDLRDPMAKGIFRLTAGRLPRTTDEVAVTSRLADRGFRIGSDLTLQVGGTRRVVGLVESGSSMDANAAVGLPGSLQLAENDNSQRSWLVTKPGGVDWSTVRQFNTHGLLVLSRSVVENPPPPSAVDDNFSDSSGLNSAEVSVLALVVAMALLEVVLLAGPAFAVGARRQQRSLALIAATGGEPPDIRRVVLASGLVLGAAAAVFGSAAGVGIAWLARPGVQHFSTERLGPFELSPRDIAGIAACGLLSALLAALAPAMLAARNDVVAVLAGRRGETRTRLRSPLFGALLLGLGIAGAVHGARQTSGETFITASAIAAVLGMVLLIPVVVAQLGRVARFLPLPARFAVRDAARHRSRTAPAVAAVAATVAGVVALAIGATSDAAETRATYTPSGPNGAAVVTAYNAKPSDWPEFDRAIRTQVPSSHITTVRGLSDGMSFGPGSKVTIVKQLTFEPVTRGPAPDNYAYSSTLGANVLAGNGALDALGVDTTAAEHAAALRTLDAGGVVLFAYDYDKRTFTQATAKKLAGPSDGSEEAKEQARWTVPASVIRVPGTSLPAQAIVSDGLLARAGMTAQTTALLVNGTSISKDQEAAITEAVSGVSPDANVSVERGYHDNSTTVILLLLGAIGGVLVLGGTLTATFLALSDARPDFATMGAVGAAPRTRRTVAAAYAATIGLVGAVLGAAVGFIPGIAVTFPLTSASYRPKGSTDIHGVTLPSHFIDVPWVLVLCLVIALPVVAAAAVALFTRSRLPMVSRLS
jgi:putative ABC transport system permease protein